jgi:hypothetical protein
MVKKVKAPHPTLEKDKEPRKQVVYLGDYFDMKLMQRRPVTLTFLEVLADKLTQWVTGNQEAVAITEFWEMIGMEPSVYYGYIKRSDKLAEAHKYALAVIGSHREVGAMKRRLDTAAVWKNQYQYHESYKEAMIFAAMLAKREEKTNENNERFVVLEKIESSPEMESLFKKKE